MAISQRHYPVPHHWRQLAVAFVVIVAFVAASLVVLPTSGSESVRPDEMIVRLALVVVGVVLSSALAVGRRELAYLLRRVGEHAHRPQLRRAARVS